MKVFLKVLLTLCLLFFLLTWIFLAVCWWILSGQTSILNTIYIAVWVWIIMFFVVFFKIWWKSEKTKIKNWESSNQSKGTPKFPEY